MSGHADPADYDYDPADYDYDPADYDPADYDHDDFVVELYVDARRR